jgi:hypothetical protein
MNITQSSFDYFTRYPIIHFVRLRVNNAPIGEPPSYIWSVEYTMYSTRAGAIAAIRSVAVTDINLVGATISVDSGSVAAEPIVGYITVTDSGYVGAYRIR